MQKIYFQIIISLLAVFFILNSSYAQDEIIINESNYLYYSHLIANGYQIGKTNGEDDQGWNNFLEIAIEEHKKKSAFLGFWGGAKYEFKPSPGQNLINLKTSQIIIKDPFGTKLGPSGIISQGIHEPDDPFPRESYSPAILNVQFKNNALSQLYSNKQAEPYCRTGGLYTLIHENTKYEEVRGFEIKRYTKKWFSWKLRSITYPLNNFVEKFTYNLYYCYTTEDLIRKIKIPQSWKDDNLIFYCNDGGSINDKKENFEFITTSINTYKACVLKNLDLEEKNTIIYGFEVGNKIIDRTQSNFFNLDTKKGPILNELVYVDGTEEFKDYNVTMGKMEIPYKQVEKCIPGFDDDGNEKDICYEHYIPKNNLEALEYAQLTKDNNITAVFNLEDYPQQICAPGQYYSDEWSDYCSLYVNSINSYNIYTYNLSQNFLLANLIYEDKLGNRYNFSYNEYDKFYSLSNTDEELNTIIIDIFDIPENFDLSRVALFKQSGNNLIYGYETPAKIFAPTIEYLNESINPIYIIDLDSLDNYGDSKCSDVLASFEQSQFGVIEHNIEILCKGNDLHIISNNINTDNDYTRAFHIFKNIITSIN